MKKQRFWDQSDSDGYSLQKREMTKTEYEKLRLGKNKPTEVRVQGQKEQMTGGPVREWA